MHHLKRSAFLFVAFATVLPCVTLANSIQILNTGVADDGTVLTPGTADSHYTLTVNPEPNASTAVATNAHPAWTQNTATASWISLGADGTNSWAEGYYTYETTFDLTNYDPATAVLSAMVAEDDDLAIYLNGSSQASYTGSGYSATSYFTLNSGFINGINTLDFVVYNASGGPTGLMVDDAVLTADTPEPAALLLLATGAALGAFQLSRWGHHLVKEGPRFP